MGSTINTLANVVRGLDGVIRNVNNANKPDLPVSARSKNVINRARAV